jgi:hypothetical protein
MLMEKLGSEETPYICGTWYFSVVLTGVDHFLLSGVRWIKSTPSYKQYAIQCIIHISVPFNVSLSCISSNQNFVHDLVSLLPDLFYNSHPTFHPSLGRLKYVVSLLRTQFSPILPSPPFPWCPDIPSALFAVCKHCRSTLVLLPFSLSEFYYEGLINTSNNRRPVGVVAW